MKKTTRILTLVFSVLLLLVFVTASARARSNPDPAPPGEIIGQIRWKKDMGLIPIAPGSNQASASACSAFYIFASTSGGFGVKSEVVAHSQPSTKQAKEDKEYYVCTYSMQVPPDAGVFVGAGMGVGDLVHGMTRQSYYMTDQWIGGTRSRPPAGRKRGFEYHYLPIRPAGSQSIFFHFEMTYVHGDNPNPTLDSSTPIKEEGASPILRRASFAGAWHAKLGEGLLELIFQQAGNRVTGQVKMNSADIGIIRDGVVVDNTLRFTIMRPPRPGFNSEFVYVGNGELVMDEGGKSFTGTVLGAATSGGTLIAR